MPLPFELQQATERAHTAMLHHPRHELLPIFRLTIYNILRSSQGGTASILLLHLLTAKYVLPIWIRVRPHDTMPQQYFDIAERILSGALDLATADKEIRDKRLVLDLEELGTGMVDNEDALRAFFACCAAVEVVNQCFGKRPFADLDIQEQMTDSDLLPVSQDGAACAACAHAGPTWVPP